MAPVTVNIKAICFKRSMVKTRHKQTVNPNIKCQLIPETKKVLTIVSTFFVGFKMLSVLSRNNRPVSSKTNILCFKTKTEIKNLHGFNCKAVALGRASINEHRR